jgi:hypothetical protein
VREEGNGVSLNFRAEVLRGRSPNPVILTRQRKKEDQLKQHVKRAQRSAEDS